MWKRTIKPFFSRETIPGWCIVIIQRVAIAVDLWGNVEFLQSKTSILQSIVANVWNFATDDFWGSNILIIAGLIILAAGIRKHINVSTEYQGQPKPANVSISSSLTKVLKKSGPPTLVDFDTANKKNRQMKCDYAVQSVRFIKPIEKVIRQQDIPVEIPCEPQRLKRLRNRIFGIRSPRIVVKGFIKQGIIFDEVNTHGVNVVIEFYEKA